MTITEAARLIEVLMADTSSATAAAASDWDYPISRETLAIYDVFDLTALAHGDPKRRPKPHNGRPFRVENAEVQRRGDIGSRSRERVADILNRLGHSI